MGEERSKLGFVVGESREVDAVREGFGVSALDRRRRQHLAKKRVEKG